MAKIGERAELRVLRAKPFGVYLDGGGLGEVLLPRKEVPENAGPGALIEVFLHTDSEDRPVATRRAPKAMPGACAMMKCVASTAVGGFVDWGLDKDLLVPFREQAARMIPGRAYLVWVRVDGTSGRLVGSTRIQRHLDRKPHSFKPGDEVSLVVFARTEMGYKAIVNGSHSGLLFAEGVFQELRPGEKTQGYIAAIRPDGKLDLTLHPDNRARVTDLESRILAELDARGGFWAIGDHSPAEEIHDELGVSKRTFKQALGALLKKRRITIGGRGIRRQDA
jgi:uncharacterized protein